MKRSVKFVSMAVLTAFVSMNVVFAADKSSSKLPTYEYEGWEYGLFGEHGESDYAKCWTGTQDGIRNDDDAKYLRLDEESAVLDALRDKGKEIVSVTVGHNEVKLDPKTHNALQRTMADGGLQFIESLAHIITIPFKAIAGVGTLIVGLFAPIWEEDGHYADTFRRGMCLVTRAAADIPKDLISTGRGFVEMVPGVGMAAFVPEVAIVKEGMAEAGLLKKDEEGAAVVDTKISEAPKASKASSAEQPYDTISVE